MSPTSSTISASAINLVLTAPLADCLCHRDRAQVEQLVQYIVEDAPADAESKRAFKFPFIACEIFTCEIDVILKTLVEDEELMDLLFSFLEPNHTHNSLLSGYFSKVVVCLMLRKTASLMKYVQNIH
ncbi:serine/threonine-protein phosphatase 6 regulatory subunit 2-like isoform X2 [Asparagus officinalis]|uniref:serine/threonine-protein phosphatase 6 regulatory subunit 2-like isoform X2 n=1 Tax=Asparagus officinalis TaxID=4686 RepID=UPI00098E6CB4|nr:serine/threonine-protein phosphatase 6 regulatory subunit 2-like isoform X2 [Asparagus officinalis]